MPSTTSSSVSSDLASSTVMTPSLPTFLMASARNLPISASPFEEMVPTWAISSFEVTFLEFLTRSATTASTARSIPRLRSIGFMPAATDLAPSRTIAAAKTVVEVGSGALRGLLVGGGNVGENAQDVALLHDQELLVVDLDFSARPFAEQHAIADLEIDRDQLAGFVTPARADRGDFALGRLFLR